jgi:Ca-activated chloride channel homolog
VVALAGAGLVVKAQEPPVFRAGVELVSLSVTATNADGRYVTDLSRDDFTVLEDGVPQEVVFFSPAEARLAISLLIDSSGSMEPRMALTRQAAASFISKLRDGDVARIIEFSDRVQVLQAFSSDRAALTAGLDRIAIGGLTSLYNAIYIALRTFDPPGEPHDQDVWRHVVVVLSDGEDNASLVTYESLLDTVKRSQGVVYTIGLALDSLLSQDPEHGRLHRESPRFLLRQLAQETGGRLLLADRPDQLKAVYDDIADELAHQYVLGYQPSPPQGRDEWRTIGVRVNQPNVQARTRPGYFAGDGLRVASR